MVLDLSDPSEWYQILAYVGGGIALFFNTLLLLFYLSIPEVRTFFVKLLFYLSICDWFAALSIFFIGSKIDSILCYIQSGFQQFFYTASFFWMGAVAFTMYMTVCKHKQYMWKYELLYHFLVWPFPIITTIIMYAVHKYANIEWRDAWCWIGTQHFWINSIMYYVPMLLMLCAITFLYIRTIIHLTKKLQTSTLMYNAASVRDRPNQTQSVYDNYNRYKTLQRELIIYLIAIILCRIWGVVASFQQTFINENDPWILLLYSFFAPLQGFVNTFLFFNSTIRKRIRQSYFCSKLTWFTFKNISEYQPLIDSKETTPTSAVLIEQNNNTNHRSAVDVNDVTVSSRGSLPENIKTDKPSSYHHTHYHSYHHSNALHALISPPMNNVETSWPYPDGPEPPSICQSLPNVGLDNIDNNNNNNNNNNGNNNNNIDGDIESDKLFTKYTSLQNENNEDMNKKKKNKKKKKKKKRNNFVDKLVHIKDKLSISKQHQETAQSLNEYIEHETGLLDKPYSTGNMPDNNMNMNRNEKQYEIYRDRFECLENDHHNTSSQYLPESLNTDWDNNILKGGVAATNAFKFDTTDSNNNHHNNNQRRIYPKEKKKRIIELEESKFEKEIIEEYTVFITTFNMADYSGTTPTLLDWMRHEFGKVYSKKKRVQRHSKTVFDPHAHGIDKKEKEKETEKEKKPTLSNEISNERMPSTISTTLNTNNSSIMSETPNISLSKLSMAGHMAQSPNKDTFSSLMSPTPQTMDNRKISGTSTASNSISPIHENANYKPDFDKIGVIPETAAISKLHDQLSTTTMAGLRAQDLMTPKINDTEKDEEEKEAEKHQKASSKKKKKIYCEYQGYPEDVDIYVFGAQEMGLDSKVFGQMLRSLVGSTNYTVLTHKRMSGIYIGILIKRDLKDLIPKKDIKVKATRTGIGNLYGNKGAVGVSFRINRTSFCFINAHLAANRSNKCLQDRIEDLVLIVQGLDLGDKQIDFTHQFHVMYLLGDLNFRIRGDYTSDAVVNIIEKGKHLTLLKNDELTTLRAPYSHRNTGYSFTNDMKLTNNPLYDATAPHKLRKTNTDPLLHKILNNNDVNSDPDIILRSQTGPANIGIRKKKKKKRLLSAGSNLNIDTKDIVSYDETIALFKNNKDADVVDVDVDVAVLTKNIIKFKKDSIGNSTPKNKLNYIDETKQDEDDDDDYNDNEQIHGHHRNMTTIIHGSDEEEDNKWNESTRNRPISAISKSSSSRSSSISKASYATGDDEWDDIEDDEENESYDNEDDDDDDDDDKIIVVDIDEAQQSEQATLKSIPEKYGTDKPEMEDPTVYSIHTAEDDDDDNNVLLENEEKVTIEIDSKSKSKKKRKKDKKKKKKKKSGKDEEMLNLLPMLQSFVEGPITFAPTYKFEKGRDQYTNKRIPAWCDRILWVSPPHPCVNIKQLVYTSSSQTPPISDHRPVFSEYHITYNKCWNPPARSQWLVSIRNFYLYLYPFMGEGDASSRATTPRHYASGSKGSSDFNKAAHHIRDSTQSIVPYLTVHSPMLATCMRTTMGRRVKTKDMILSLSSPLNNDNNNNNNNNNGNSLNSSDIGSNQSFLSDLESLLCYKFNTKQFVVRCIDNSNLGNGCLWVVIRDDNLLGDVDVIGASAIPLIDTIKLAKHAFNGDGDDEIKKDDYSKYNDVYIHFKRDVTFATCKRGYIEGQMKCEVMH